MIISILWWLTVFTLVLLLIGYIGNEPGLQMVAFGFLFLIGINFVSGTGLEYETGYIQEQIAENTTMTIYTHETYENKTLGFFTAAIAIAGFVFSLVNIKNVRGMKG